jgi:hypothetical protein
MSKRSLRPAFAADGADSAEAGVCSIPPTRGSNTFARNGRKSSARSSETDAVADEEVADDEVADEEVTDDEVTDNGVGASVCACAGAASTTANSTKTVMQTLGRSAMNLIERKNDELFLGSAQYEY